MHPSRARPGELRADATNLIVQSREGNRDAIDSLFAAAYQELRRLARARLRAGGRDAVLDTTALVHEAYVRLVDVEQPKFRDRAHFLRYASHAMRSVIVDLIRHRQAQRRGGDAVHVSFTEASPEATPAGEREILRIHQGLDRLAEVDSRLAQTVEMRYFGGMTETEIAVALALTDRTVRRDLAKARLLLRASFG
ncbi:MAG TPA: ECF-type sigma factor [Terriglobia bacterium]|nr:ECF-type sigma factor [Terriglobia bacterium]